MPHRGRDPSDSNVNELALKKRRVESPASSEDEEFPDVYTIPKFKTLIEVERIAALARFFERHNIRKPYVDDVKKCTSWNEAVQRGLVLGAAAQRGVADKLEENLVLERSAAAKKRELSGVSQPITVDTSVLAQRYNIVATVNSENSFMVMQARETGHFAFSLFTPIVDMCLLDLFVERFNSDTRVLVEATSELQSRHLEVRQLVQYSIILEAVTRGELAVVCGPSGSGKTATTLSTLRGFPCIYLSKFVSSDISDEDLGKRSEGDRNRLVVERIYQRLDSLLNKRVTKACDAKVVLVLDELGETPNFLRALCALHKPAPKAKTSTPEEAATHEGRQKLLIRLKELLKVTEVHIVAVGTGCDRPEGTVGSVNSSYRIIHLDDAFGTRVRDALLEESADASLRTLLKCPEVSFEMDRVRRALLNPRVAAAFLEEATNSRWQNCDWVRRAPAILDLAFERYFSLNRLSDLTYLERSYRFRRAVALSLGGIHQTMEPKYTALCTRYGLLSDCALRVTKDGFHDGCYEMVREDGDDVLVVVASKTHRYEMSAATLEMILSTVFGFSVQQRSGEGFELTMVDFLLVQLLAGSTGIVIEPVAGDPLEQVKKHVRTLATGVDALFAMQLQKPVRGPEEALIEAARRVAVLLNRTQPTFSRGKQEVVFAAVVRNSDKAPAADAFVVRGVLKQQTFDNNRREWAWTGAGQHSEGHLPLSLQFKHYTATKISEYVTRAEFFKMGRVSGKDFAGYIACAAKATHSTEEKFLAFMRKKAKEWNVAVGTSDDAMEEVVRQHHKKFFCGVGDDTVCRQTIFDTLSTMNVVKSGTEPAAAAVYVVALLPGKCEYTDANFVQLYDGHGGTEALERSIHPVAVRRSRGSGGGGDVDNLRVLPMYTPLQNKGGGAS